jgi:hypothetical protein
MIVNLLISILVMGSWGSGSSAYAEESTTNKTKGTTDDVKTNAKKTARTEARKIRQGTGNDTLGKDIKDESDDLKGEVNNRVKRDNMY